MCSKINTTLICSEVDIGKTFRFFNVLAPNMVIRGNREYDQKPLRTRAATPNVPVHLWWTVFEELAAGRRVRSNRIRKGFREILSSYLHQSQQSVCERHQTLWRKSFKASFRAPSCVLNCGWHRQWWSEILRQLNWLNSEKHVSSSS
ncbi:hypothetical protein F2P81_002414 [Scophthalmus maximus]|uniref:Uncharacterized protein n=1 Tax=Scophthalmus maximus TaxID=52904 RepID=A0A6A4TKX4_SCOMX|nr:hypothetical protein F2P81_002414 [Scophthalmus maximus]